MHITVMEMMCQEADMMTTEVKRCSLDGQMKDFAGPFEMVHLKISVTVCLNLFW